MQNSMQNIYYYKAERDIQRINLFMFGKSGKLFLVDREYNQFLMDLKYEDWSLVCFGQVEGMFSVTVNATSTFCSPEGMNEIHDKNIHNIVDIDFYSTHKNK